MIGLALVTLVGVLAAGLKSTFADAVDKLFSADYALTSQTGSRRLASRPRTRSRACPGSRW